MKNLIILIVFLIGTVYSNYLKPFANLDVIVFIMLGICLVMNKLDDIEKLINKNQDDNIKRFTKI